MCDHFRDAITKTKFFFSIWYPALVNTFVCDGEKHRVASRVLQNEFFSYVCVFTYKRLQVEFRLQKLSFDLMNILWFCRLESNDVTNWVFYRRLLHPYHEVATRRMPFSYPLSYRVDSSENRGSCQTSSWSSEPDEANIQTSSKCWTGAPALLLHRVREALLRCRHVRARLALPCNNAGNVQHIFALCRAKRLAMMAFREDEVVNKNGWWKSLAFAACYVISVCGERQRLEKARSNVFCKN